MSPLVGTLRGRRPDREEGGDCADRPPEPVARARCWFRLGRLHDGESWAAIDCGRRDILGVTPNRSIPSWRHGVRCLRTARPKEVREPAIRPETLRYTSRPPSCLLRCLRSPYPSRYLA